MKCPNCGRQVRSKNQCAFCGCKFNSKDIKESQRVSHSEEDRVVRDRTEDWSTRETYPKSREPIEPEKRIDEPVKVSENEERYDTHDNATSLPSDELEAGQELDLENRDYAQVTESQPVIKNRDPRVDADLYYDESPRPKRDGGIGSFIWSVVKIIIGVAIIFGLFLFGPQIFSRVVNLFQPESSQVSELPESQTEEGMESANEQSGEPVSDAEDTNNELSQGEELSEASQDGETAADESSSDQEITEEDQEDASQEETSDINGQGIALASSEIDTANYPAVEFTLKFDDDISELNGEDIQLSVERNGERIDLERGYSIIREGEKLFINFNDPFANQNLSEPSSAVLSIQSDEFGLNEQIGYSVPASTVDSEVVEQLNSVFDQTVSQDANVSAIVYSPNSTMPYAYQDEVHEAGGMIGLFIVARVYEQVSQELLGLDDTVTLEADLIANNDGGEIAQMGEGVEFTLRQLIYETLVNRDATAMNHLIDVTGGGSDFMYWLNESGYYNTRLDDLINLDEEGHTQGAQTNAQDIATLMLRLANNELVSEEYDELYRQTLLDSQLTEKFPYETLAAVTRRYELSTSDENALEQHYAGILETEDGPFVVVILADQFNDAQTVVSNIASAIEQIVTGVPTETEETEEADEVTSEEAVAEPAEQEQNQGQANTGPYEEWQLMYSEGGYVYGPDEDGDGMRDTVMNENGVFVPIRWTQGADGLWRFTIVE